MEADKTAEMPRQRVDIAIIGGGIQGVGIAQAAAAAGFSVILAEKSHLAAGTSSKSSKLIHGGLRYLQQGHFKLVRESLRERDILCNIAPHLVRLNNFYIPVYQHSNYHAWQLRLGLSVYALLGGLKPSTRFKTIAKNKWTNLAGLQTSGLNTVFCYQDAQTDDTRLTQAVARSAQQLGAKIYCQTNVLKAEKQPEGYQLTVQTQGFQQTLDCRVLINAAGPWVNIVAQTISPAPQVLDMAVVQGSHLVIDPQLSKYCFYLESLDDNRAVFVLPWQGKTLLGTTETPFTGNPDQASTLRTEQDYLLQTLKYYFPEYVKTPLIISSTMAGLRVLPVSSASPFRRNREIRFASSTDSNSRYIALYGGKLTGYRATAAKVTEKIQKILGTRTVIADTATLKLP